MGSLQKVCLCLLLTTILALNASGQRNRYNYNNNNNNNYNYNNNQNSGYRGSSVCDDPENPCEEGRPIDIPCPAQYSGQADDVVSCIWKHKIPASSNNGIDTQTHITCAASELGCKGGAGVDQTYLNERKVSYSTAPCALRIERAHPDDSAVGNDGEWECHLQTDSEINGLATTIGTVAIYVSNVTEIAITEPTDGDDIQYDLSRQSRAIEATCTGFGGLPEPTFHWYLDDDDDDNEITDGEASFDINSYDDRNGRRVEHTISFSPTLQTLCDLNLDEACDIINGDEDFNGLNFNLICKAEQSVGQYQDENNRQQASVMVEVSSANSLSIITYLIPLLWMSLRLFS